MFTGLVEEKGEVLSFHEQPEAWRLRVRAKLVAEDLELGDSVAVNGCCLSVVEISKNLLTFDVLEETRRLTNLRNLDLGSKVNLERSMRFNGRVGGHFLTGHVDGVGKIVELGMRGRDVALRVEAPENSEQYLVYKGCIGIDGISLTVAEVQDRTLTVWLIPHTLQVTALGDLKRGDQVNLEFDLLAKYTEKILSQQERQMRSQINSIVDELKRLRKNGLDHIFVSNESLRSLKLATKGIAQVVSEKEAKRAVAAIPERIRSATPEEFDRVLKEEPKVESRAPRNKGQDLGTPPGFQLPKGDKQKRWDALREIVLNCPTCQENVREGYQIVFGVGNLDADIFFCGEAPGADEEEKGEPFVGKAGQLLDKMINAMGLAREDVYIGNIMNWRPQLPTRVGNRPPTLEEIRFCLPYLKAQVEVVKPKLIVALGATAAKGLLGPSSFRSLREVKGEWREFEKTPVLATYHPSYLLRNDSKRDKRSAWEDLLKVMERCGLPISDRQRGYFLQF